MPSSGSEGELGIRVRQPGFVDEGVDGDWPGELGGTWEWRREKKSLMLWLSRLTEPLEVRREIRPSVR